MIGQKFGFLTVVTQIGISEKTGRPLWACRCDCNGVDGYDGIKIVEENLLKYGDTRSCGCLLSHNHYIHGMSGTKVHNTWVAMRQRCDNPNREDYPNYGGRGIKYCDRWKEFANFYADMGDPPTPDATINRLNNDGMYEPGNVEWSISRSEQRRNRRDSLHMIEWDGRTMCVADWEKELGANYNVIRKRLLRGQSIEQAMMPGSQVIKKIFINGEEKTIKQIAEETGNNEATIAKRIREGFPPEKIMTKGLLEPSKVGGQLNKTHGHTATIDGKQKRSPTYKVWAKMKQSCDNPNDKNYKNNGALGISYDSRWDNFKNFLEDMGEKPEDKTLMLIYPEENYSKENCIWATMDLVHSRRSNAQLIPWDGQEKTIFQWEKEKGWKKGSLWYRIQAGWSIERSFTTSF